MDLRLRTFFFFLKFSIIFILVDYIYNHDSNILSVVYPSNSMRKAKIRLCIRCENFKQ